LGRGIIVTLEAVRFKFQVQVGEIRSLPGLIDNNKGRYAVVIFEDLYMYLNLQGQNRANLDQYCRDFNVGIVFLLHYRKKPEDNPMAINEASYVGSFPLRFMSSVRLKDYEINATSPLLRITRPGSVVMPSPNDWTIFLPYHHTYTAIKTPETEENQKAVKNIDNQEKLIPVLLDQGLYDGIQRVFFGNNLKFWLQKVLFLDALSYLSYGRLSLPLERYFQIDIDDIFVGVAESRLLVNDVQALLNFQTELRKNVPGFTYQLGFSGKFIYSGTDEESEGDRMLLKLADNFSWFPHMWSHMQAHWFSNASKLCEYMDINRQFALRHSLNTSSNYAVAPHHAGVYPVHQQLYHCWRKVWNITSTSSEEYPNLRPDHRRKGFIYRNIMV
uniref:Uncharacterized protein n=1 Tax=Ciona savignyi TaxID=51511 RepID=H2YCB2_CIOSA